MGDFEVENDRIDKKPEMKGAGVLSFVAAALQSIITVLACVRRTNTAVVL